MARLHWFTDWLLQHRLLHKDLPDLMSEEGRVTFDAWHDAITGRRISPEGAAQASKRLVAEPPRFRNQHFPTFLEFAIEATRALDQQNGRAAKHDLSTREGAELASKNCDRCCGSGLATVEFYHRDVAAEHKIPETVAAYCVCAIGRWIERNHSEKAKDIRQRTPDLADAIAHRGPWLVHRSCEPDGEVMELTVREMVEQMVEGHRMKPALAQVDAA